LADLPALGLTEIGFAGDVPPLMLVIVHGDIDITQTQTASLVVPAMRRPRVKYIAYVFDLRAGVPTLMETSIRGGKFRRALNDPSLPDDIPLVSPNVTKGLSVPDMPHPTPYPTTTIRTPYGAIAPTVMPGPPR
jgi:hypothetical protein